MTKKFEPQLKVVQIGNAYVSEVLDEYKVELDLGVEKAIIDWNAYPEGKPEQVAEDYGGHVVTLIEEPEKVVLTNEQEKIVKMANQCQFPANYISQYTYPDDEKLLMKAYVNGYTVEKEPVSLVYVPGTNKKFLYNKRGDNSTRAAKLETPIVPSPVTSYQTAYGQYKPLYWFTDEEITKFSLQDCEREEVTDDDD